MAWNNPYLLQPALHLLRLRRERNEARRLEHELDRCGERCFTRDWIANVTTSWSRFLEPWVGLPGVAMLEIGSYEGRSAVWFLENVLTHPSSHLTCIDLFRHAPRNVRFDHNVRKWTAAGRLEKLQGPSSDVLPRIATRRFDLIYVDGSHLAPDVLFDGIACWLMLNPGGLLIFDDYAWEPSLPVSERPQVAVDMFLAALAGQYELLFKDYQVIVRKPVSASTDHLRKNS